MAGYLFPVFLCFCAYLVPTRAEVDLDTDIWKYLAHEQSLNRHMWIALKEMEREEAADECRKLSTLLGKDRKLAKYANRDGFFLNTLLDESEEGPMFDYYKSINLKEVLWAGRVQDPRKSGCHSDKRNCCVTLSWDEENKEYKFSPPELVSCAEKHLSVCAFEEPGEIVDYQW